MATSKNCSACTDLQKYAPGFVTNGVTDAVCNSLQNNTGFSTKNSRNNCTDIGDANDCLIGNLADEIDGYDNCDWKDYLRRLVPNIYHVLSAITCWLCGLQKRVDDLSAKQSDMCQLIEAMIKPPTVSYGTRPLAKTPALVRCGTIPNKNGHPIMEKIPEPETNQYTKESQNVGIKYAQLKVNSCKDGKCKLYEWLAPSIFEYRFTEDIAEGDILWYVSKSDLQNLCGFSDSLWQGYTESSWTWTTFGLWASRRYAWVQLTVDENRMGKNYLTMVYRGTSNPNGGPGHTDAIQPDSPEKLYVSDC